MKISLGCIIVYNLKSEHEVCRIRKQSSLRMVKIFSADSDYQRIAPIISCKFLGNYEII